MILIITVLSLSLSLSLSQYTLGERITNHIRVAYVRALLIQEMEFYDKSVPRELVMRLSQDVDAISDAVGEKVGQLLENGAQFFTGTKESSSPFNCTLVFPAIEISPIFSFF